MVPKEYDLRQFASSAMWRFRMITLAAVFSAAAASASAPEPNAAIVGAAVPSYALGERNLALRRPCEPAPECSALLLEEPLAGQPHTEAIRRSDKLKGLKVFLERSFFVGHVSVQCGSHPHAAKEIPLEADELTQRAFLLTTWFGDGSLGEQGSRSMAIAPAVKVDNDGVRLTFRVDAMATAVALDWGVAWLGRAEPQNAENAVGASGPTASGEGSVVRFGGLCGRLPTSRVEVLEGGSRDALRGSAQSAEVAGAPRRQSITVVESVPAALGAPTAIMPEAGHEHVESANAPEPANAAPQATAASDETAGFGFLAARTGAVEPEQWLGAFTVMFIVFVLMLTVVPAWSCAASLIKAVWGHRSKCLGSQYGQAALPMATSTAAADVDGRREETAYFFIGGESTDDDREAGSPSESSTGEWRARPTCLGRTQEEAALQPAGQCSSRPSASEPEPEAEDDPSVPCIPARSAHREPRVREPLICLPSPQTSFSSPSIEAVLAHPATPATSSSAGTGASADSAAGSRFLMLYASPLCRLDPVRGPTPMAQLPFEREWGAVVRAHQEAANALRVSGRSGPAPGAGRASASSRRRPLVSLAAQPLTASTLQRAVAPGTAGTTTSVLHLSAHGVQDCLVLEDGKGTAHMLSCNLLRGMLSLRRVGCGVPKLVVLNACSSRSIGGCFVEGGVPHVLCAAVDLPDSWSRVFLGTFYASLFQGQSVASSFQAARMALLSDPVAPREAASAFRLLPEGGNHNTVLFPSDHHCLGAQRGGWAPAFAKGFVDAGVLSLDPTPASSSSGREESLCESDGGASPSDSDGVSNVGVDSLRDLALGSSLPPRVARRPGSLAVPPRLSPLQLPVPVLPEDYIGRQMDVWAVLQHLSNRRAVVVCGEGSSEPGIGKSVVLDAVHRAYALQVGAACVAVELRAHVADPALGGGWWIEQVRVAVQRTLQHRRRQRAGATTTGVGCSSVAHRLLRRQLRRSTGSDGGTATAGVHKGFHPLSDPVATGLALEALIADVTRLEEFWQERRVGLGGAATTGILLVLDACDHLIQQQRFQAALAEVLGRCATLRVLLSTHQRMVGTAGGQFKVVHHALRGLAPSDAAQLFLRRAQRPLRWGELQATGYGAGSSHERSLDRPVVLRAGEEAEVLSLLARHPAVSAQRGNPRRLIEVACRVSPTLRNLSDLVPPIMASAVMSDQAQSSDAGASAADAIQAHCASDETHRPRQATVLGSCRSSSVTAHPLGTPPILFKAVQVSGAGAVPD